MLLSEGLPDTDNFSLSILDISDVAKIAELLFLLHNFSSGRLSARPTLRQR